MKPVLSRSFMVFCLLWLGSGMAYSATVKHIVLNADESVNRARIDDLLEIKEGEEFSRNDLAKGLARIASGGLFKKVNATFDDSTGTLTVSVEPLDRVIAIEIVLARDAKLEERLRDFMEQDLRDNIPVRVGSDIQIDFVPGIRKKLENRLRDRGFSQPSIVVALQDTPRPYQKKLIVSVNPGNREYISGFDLLDFQNKDVQNLREELSEQIGFSDIFPEFRTPDKLVDYPEEYLVKNIQFQKKIDRSREIRSYAKVPLDWVAINQSLASWSARSRSSGYYEFRYNVDVVSSDKGRLLRIDLKGGPKYLVKFHGNVFFWERDLRTQMLDKTLRLGVPLNLQEAQNQLITRYRHEGFADVAAQYEVTQSKGILTVNFEINEGRRYYIENIIWDGLSPDEVDLVKPLVDRWRSDVTIGRLHYSEDLVPVWIEELSAILRNNGYLSMRVLGHRAIHQKDSSAVDLEFSAQLGTRYHVRDVVVTGRPLLPSKELKSAIILKKGDWASLEKIIQTSDNIKSLHSKKGFVNCSVSKKPEDIVKYSEESDEVDLVYTVDPGPSVRVGKVLVEGLSRVKEKVVQREFSTRDFTQGSVWNPDAAQEAEGSLLGLGVFGSVKRDPVGGRLLSRAEETGSPVDVIEQDLKVQVNERPAGSLEFGPGFRTDTGVQAFAEFNYRNLGGMNRSIFLRAQVSRKVNQDQYLFPEYKLSASFLEPYLFEWPLRFRISSLLSKQDLRVFNDSSSSIPTGGFAERERAVNFFIEKDINRWKISQAIYSLDWPEIFDVVPVTGGGISSTLTKKYRIAAWDTFVSYDTRDNLFNPTRGIYWSANFEYASPWLGSFDDVNYYSLSSQISGYYTPIRHVTLAAWLSVGHIDSLGGATTLPETKRLFLGGRGSIRSLAEQSLRFDDLVVPQEESAEMKLEYRQTFLADFGIALFFDGGQLWGYLPQAIDPGWNTQGFRMALGSGLRYQTPVGPLALDLAFNLNRRVDLKEDPYRIILSVGNL